MKLHKVSYKIGMTCVPVGVLAILLHSMLGRVVTAWVMSTVLIGMFVCVFLSLLSLWTDED